MRDYTLNIGGALKKIAQLSTGDINWCLDKINRGEYTNRGINAATTEAVVERLKIELTARSLP